MQFNIMIFINEIKLIMLLIFDKENNIFEIVKEKEEFKLIKTLEIKLSDFGASK